MSEPFICISGLRKSYVMGHVAVHALDGIDLAIEAGSFLIVMGPSGSGKSTLLHLVGGLDRPTEGHIEIDGQSIESMDENALAVYRRRTVGFIFQSFNLIPTMTALENVAFPMQFARLPRKYRQARALELLQEVGLQDRALHRPTELSGGEQQRVAIARALVNDPELILADEPTGNLDTASGIAIMQLLSKFHRGGRTVIGVTHDARMRQFATDTVQLLDGHLVDGGYTNNLSNPNN
ncbi:MAG: macrolide ABC transporter ATP-binding protein [Chloroflexi bacterium RBG_19FT_COMBO_55_16]|nr:MAG: macrolide ABC transporter ATP-binding protein [Chloroflexi bacterium RBG_19FT_COMBO_55_16]